MPTTWDGIEVPVMGDEIEILGTAYRVQSVGLGDEPYRLPPDVRTQLLRAPIDDRLRLVLELEETRGE